MSYPFTQLYSPTSTGTLTAAQYNAEFQNVINNHIPESMDDYSVNASEMRIQTDPGESGSESLPTTLAEEIERLRFAIKEAKNMWGSVTYWYETPTIGSTLTRTTNADALTISATNTGFSNTILTLQTAEENTGSFYFLKLISDTDGTPTTEFSVDQDGNVVCDDIVFASIGATPANLAAAAMTSTGANAIATTMTSTGADAIAADVSATGANAIAATMTSTGANAIASTMTATGADAIAADISTTGTGSIVSTASAADVETLMDKKTWTDFTPSFTGQDSQVIDECKYVQIGKFVYFYFSVNINPTLAATSYNFTLPVAAASGSFMIIGMGTGYTGAGTTPIAVYSAGAGTTAQINSLNGVAFENSTNWSAYAQGFYRVA